jgi:hypothetical protein
LTGEWKTVDLGLVHSSAAPSISQLIIERLVQAGDVEDKAVSPNFLIRNWPPIFKEWSTQSIRNAFFASPQFPRLLNPDSIKDTIARGVENGMLGYVGRKADGGYAPFHWNSSLSSQDVEISDDVFLIQQEVAEAYKAAQGKAMQIADGASNVPDAATPPIGGGGISRPEISPEEEICAPSPTTLPNPYGVGAYLTKSG